MSDGLSRQERLSRDVQVNSAIFVELKKQYELAKLDEVKNITIVNILDPARAPVRKERPTRLITRDWLFSALSLRCQYASAYGPIIPIDSPHWSRSCGHPSRI